MSLSTAAYHHDESRTHAASQAVSHQGWKSRAAAGQRDEPRQDEARTASRAIEVNRSFPDALAAGSSGGRQAPRGFEAALAQSEPADHAARPAADEFSFDDFIDIINPLQHLPVLGMLYRELTGDTIKPAAQIVGGGLFGGPIGAVSGTVNAVVQESTGKDIAGNVLTLVTGGDAGPADTSAPASIDRDNPEMALSLAAAQYGGQAFVPQLQAQTAAPAGAMAFAPQRAAAHYEKTAVADGRTAGWNVKAVPAPALDVDYSPAEISLNDLPAREAITVLPMKGPYYNSLY